MKKNIDKKVEELKDTDLEDLDKEFESLKEEKKKRSIGRIISNIIIAIIFLIIILEAAIGIINMQKINNDEDPVWYLSTKTVETDKKTETTYNLGLYKIVKTDTSKQVKITLKPFFIK